MNSKRCSVLTSMLWLLIALHTDYDDIMSDETPRMSQTKHLNNL